MRWENSWVFFLFLPYFFILYRLWRRQKKKKAFPFAHVGFLKEVTPAIRTYFLFLPPLLKHTAFVLALVALARPQNVESRVQRKVKGLDIMLALDISDSMLIEDMEPENRLEASKATIAEFIQKRTSDRLGLLVFSGEVYTRVPMTLDYVLLTESLSQVSSSQTLQKGTAIGMALAGAVARLRNSEAKSRIVIFLTDGENNSGHISPQTALQIAKGYGIKVYSIAMGKTGRTRIPYYRYGINGKRVKLYKPFESRVNEKLLKSMARETGGTFYRATDGESLQRIFQDIDRLEKTQLKVESYRKYNELFGKFLLWALLSLFLSFVFNEFLFRKVS